MKYKIQHKKGSKIVNLNRRRAVRERCLNCSGWMYKDVSGCEFTNCQLHAFRTCQGKQNAKARGQAIRSFCLWCMNDQRKEVKRCTSPNCSLFPYRQTVTDQSAEIKSLPQKDHMGSVFKDNSKETYQIIHDVKWYQMHLPF